MGCLFRAVLPFSPFIYNMVYPYCSPFHPVRESPCKTALKTSVLRKSSSKTSKKVLALFAVMEKGRTFAPAFGNGSGAPWEVLKKTCRKIWKQGGKVLIFASAFRKKRRAEPKRVLWQALHKWYRNSTRAFTGMYMHIGEVPRETVNTWIEYGFRGRERHSKIGKEILTMESLILAQDER